MYKTSKQGNVHLSLFKPFNFFTSVKDKSYLVAGRPLQSW